MVPVWHVILLLSYVLNWCRVLIHLSCCGFVLIRAQCKCEVPYSSLCCLYCSVLTFLWAPTWSAADHILASLELLMQYYFLDKVFNSRGAFPLFQSETMMMSPSPWEKVPFGIFTKTFCQVLNSWLDGTPWFLYLSRKIYVFFRLV